MFNSLEYCFKMLYKRDFYTLSLEKSLYRLEKVPRRGPRTNNVPPSRFFPSKTQSVPARLHTYTHTHTHTHANILFGLFSAMTAKSLNLRVLSDITK